WPLNFIRKLLSPAKALLDDQQFWTKQSDGLALFISPDHFETFTLPISFHAYRHIGNRFHLRPLLPMFHGDGRFFVLALSQQQIRFFEGMRHQIIPVRIEDLMPEETAKQLTYTDQYPNLQFHSAGTGGRHAIYHGHGAGKDQQDKELEKYFRLVDDGLMTMLFDEQVPMIIAGVDYMVHAYRQQSRYEYIVDELISGNPEHWSPVQLHEQAWSKMENHFQQKRQSAIDQYKELQNSPQTNQQSIDLVPEAANGRIDTLFINRDKFDLWGHFDPSQHIIEVHRRHRSHSECLLELAAKYTFLQGGKVYH
ncbi:MAG: hypothetical protein AAFV80_24555, partial [Bacteroidota bacterium]